MKRLIKPIIMIYIFLFLGLYIFYNHGYKEAQIKKEQLLIEEKVKEYEEDLHNGIDVSKKDYTIKKNNYNNKYTKVNIKIGKTIEKIISTGIRVVFRKMNDIVSEK